MPFPKPPLTANRAIESGINPKRPKGAKAVLRMTEADLAHTLEEDLCLRMGDSIGYLKLPDKFKKLYRLLDKTLPNPRAYLTESEDGFVRLTYTWRRRDLEDAPARPPPKRAQAAAPATDVPPTSSIATESNIGES